MSKLFRASLWEIRRSPALQKFGFALGFGFLLIFKAGLTEGQGSFYQPQGGSELCPMLSFWCSWFMGQSVTWDHLAHFGLITSSLAALMFFFNRWLHLACWLLFGTHMSLLFLYGLNGTWANSHIVLMLMAAFLFLWVPNKKDCLRILVAGFLVTTGLNFLNTEWLTGSWILERLPVQPKMGEWLSALVALSYIVAPALLLIRDVRFFAVGFLLATATQVLLFIVDQPFEPAIQSLGLSLFLFAFIEERKQARERFFQSYVHPEPSRLWVLLVFILFLVSQAPVRFALGPAALQLWTSSLVIRPKLQSHQCRVLQYWHETQEHHVAIGRVSMDSETSSEVMRSAQRGTESEKPAVPSDPTKTPLLADDVSREKSSHHSSKDLLPCQPRHLVNLAMKNCGSAQGPIDAAFYLRSFQEIQFVKIFHSHNICQEGDKLVEQLRIQSW